MGRPVGIRRPHGTFHSTNGYQWVPCIVVQDLVGYPDGYVDPIGVLRLMGGPVEVCVSYRLRHLVRIPHGTP